jgi:hypothetical protein
MDTLHYWPWWSGAIALFAVTVGHFRIVGRPFGVSGAWSRIVFMREEQKVAAAEQRMGDDRRAIEAALIAATLEEFGPEAVRALEAERARLSVATAPQPQTIARRASWKESLAMLGGMAIGGGIAAALSGDLGGGLQMHADLTRLYGAGWLGPAVLLVGGGLIGFGTQMAGGCTSGHGLSGCSRFQVGSLVATAIFFVTAFVIATVLEHLPR